jgi:hypothetical protein
MILIWDRFNANDAFTLDGATAYASNDDLLSVSFDGSKPGWGFSRDLVDLSDWDGASESTKVQPVISAVKKMADHHDVFVSYARKDAKIAQKLCSHLGKVHWSVWWDAALKAGETFRGVIDAKLSQVSSLVVLWTTESINSHWVLDEATVGRDRGVLIPVLLEDVKIPTGFGQIHTIRCFRQSPADLERLCDEITSRMRQKRLDEK